MAGRPVLYRNMKDDNEELALNLNGQKRSIRMNDFTPAMERFRIPQKAIVNIIKRFEGIELKWKEVIRRSFLANPMKEAYSELISERIKQLGLQP